MKILFVCLGNICRSPLAEAIFNEKVKQRGLDKIHQADSCGTSNYNIGDDPDHRTMKSARENNIPLNHKARQLRKSDIEEFDLILGMDRNNLKHIQELSSDDHVAKIKLMRVYDPHGEGDVPDPYYGSEKDFDKVFEILDRSIETLVNDIVKSQSRK